MLNDHLNSGRNNNNNNISNDSNLKKVKFLLNLKDRKSLSFQELRYINCVWTLEKVK